MHKSFQHQSRPSPVLYSWDGVLRPTRFLLLLLNKDDSYDQIVAFWVFKNEAHCHHVQLETVICLLFLAVTFSCCITFHLTLVQNMYHTLHGFKQHLHKVFCCSRGSVAHFAPKHNGLWERNHPLPEHYDGCVLFILAYYCLNMWTWDHQPSGKCSQRWARLTKAHVLVDFISLLPWCHGTKPCVWRCAHPQVCLQLTK